MTSPLAQPNRIALAGDWHMNGPWATKAIRYAKDQGADVIVHLGDFGYTFDARFMRAVEKALMAAGLDLLFVDGNHEDFQCLHRYRVGDNGLRKMTDHIWHLPRGFRWNWSGVRFLALGGAHSVDRPWREPGTSWWRQETITEQEAADCIAAGPADVMVVHDCPAGVTVPGIDDRTTDPPYPAFEILRSQEHRQLLRTVVDAVQPKMLWHGHYHTAYRQNVDLGYGPLTVTGLDCDETTVTGNVQVVSLADVQALVGEHGIVAPGR